MHPSFARSQHGFTLIEVLLATVLLAAGLTLAFATLRSTMAVTQRGEALAGRNEHIRAVEGFLRRSISGALRITMEVDPQSRRPVRFVGEPERMRFVSDLPAYLGHGGPYQHVLSLQGEGDAQQLQVALALVQGSEIIAAQDARPPEPLAVGLREVNFRYRGLDPRRNDALGDWQDHWDAVERLPLLVEIRLRDDVGVWPPVIVALPQGGRPEMR